MNIITKLSNNKNHFNGYNPCNYITIHQTGNTGRGANALNHANYMNNGSGATWHYTVDSERVVQHFNNRVQCWHSGDGKGKGNTQSIGIELCVNSDGNYNKTIENATKLVRQLMKQHNVSINNVVQHNKWSGKNCPSQIRAKKNGIGWVQFIQMVEGAKPSTPTISVPVTSSDRIEKLARKVIRGDYGNGITRQQKLGKDFNAVQKRVNELLR